MLVRFLNLQPYFITRFCSLRTENMTASERGKTHHAVQLHPVDLIAVADPGLLGLQRVREGADLEHQEVESFQNFSAINDSISQSMTGLTM